MNHPSWLLRITWVTMCLWYHASVAATDQLHVSKTPLALSSIPSPPPVPAQAYLLVDVNSGRVLAQKQADAHVAPASLTKMMTMYVLAHALKTHQTDLDERVHISHHAWETGGSRMFVKEGTDVPMSRLIAGMMVASGNDATMAIAQHIAGNESHFVDLMNQAAQALGLKNTHFTNATGVPKDNHYSTARDLATLAGALMVQYPQYTHWLKDKTFTYSHIKQHNRNLLLWRDPSVDGVKTGHTDAAGYCLAASARRHGMHLIAVVLHTPSSNARAQAAARLLNYGFHFYKTHQVALAHQPLMGLRVWQGQKHTITLGLAEDWYVTVPRLEQLKLGIVKHHPADAIAPVKEGQVMGTIEARHRGHVISQRPLIALEGSPKGNWFWRHWDLMLQRLQPWFHVG